MFTDDVRDKVWNEIRQRDLRAFSKQLTPEVFAEAADLMKALIETLWKQLSKHRVGHRPNRIEPRAVKRRPKPHDLLMQSRADARAALLTGKK